MTSERGGEERELPDISFNCMSVMLSSFITMDCGHGVSIDAALEHLARVELFSDALIDEEFAADESLRSEVHGNGFNALRRMLEAEGWRRPESAGHAEPEQWTEDIGVYVDSAGVAQFIGTSKEGARWIWAAVLAINEAAGTKLQWPDINMIVSFARETVDHYVAEAEAAGLKVRRVSKSAAAVDFLRREEWGETI